MAITGAERISPTPDRMDFGGVEVLDSDRTPWAGFSLTVSRYPERGSTREYTFSRSVIALLSHGEAKVRIEARGVNTALRLYPGAMLIFPAGAEVDLLSWVGAHEQILVFPSEERWDAFDAVTAKVPYRPPPAHLVFRDLELEALLRTMRLEVAADCPSGPLFAEALSIAMLARAVSQPWKSLESASGGKALTSLQERRVREYIHSHLDETIHLENLAALLDTSVGHFSRLFRNTFGMPPYRYLLERRVDEAKRLMATGGLSMTEIALKLHFGSPSHFSATFRKIAGITPRQFLFRL
jgi:AraC-like DNA-binding protein